MRKRTRELALLLLLYLPIPLLAQQPKPVYIDPQGVMRWTGTDEEAAFFGVNYTVPFAYGYRSHQDLGVDLKEAMRQDVYHFERLGFNAFRVHLWDTEISDTLGNLLNNEHLELFDFLVDELKKRKIKTLLTPIAYWGNGYPQPDEDTPGFSRRYGKGRANREEAAIAAQENFLKQFFRHVNPYTKLSYGADPDIIAMEINNEPSHGGSKEEITKYINRMIAAVRSTGWQKPIFYNISQNPWCADAVARSDAEGFAFQWYPTGLVANRSLEGNYLPNVDHYTIRFGDTIPEYHHKALMVYEFDAGDVLQSNMYPMMARSFREAGFQWATQFAYDPLATAYANTEYQTHFVNLAYSPGKALSLMIASRVFHEIPRLQRFQDYPQDTVFGSFLVSYAHDLSMMNSAEEYYYSNTTSIAPRAEAQLQHIAGVGNSPIITYEGTGAYFLDKVAPGLWRLEVMPDAVIVDDPFGRASPKRPVSEVIWNTHAMRIGLNDLGEAFEIKDLQSKQEMVRASGGSFAVSPGIYLLSEQSGAATPPSVSTGFVAPPASGRTLKVYHRPAKIAAANTPLKLEVTVPLADTALEVYALLNSGPWQLRRVDLEATAPYLYSGAIAAEQVMPGLLGYRIIVRRGEEYWVEPGKLHENPFAWDNHRNESFEVFVSRQDAPAVLFDANLHRAEVMYYNRHFQDNQLSWTAADQAGQLAFRLQIKNDIADNAAGFQRFFGNESYQAGIAGKTPTAIEVRLKNDGAEKIKVTIKLIDRVANAFAAELEVAGGRGYESYTIPLTEFRPAPALQLPRPYPGFQDLWHETPAAAHLQVDQLEKVEVVAFSEAGLGEAYTTFEIVHILLSR